MAANQENILIVDDEDVVRKVLYTELSRHGYECQEADNADHALEKLRSSPAALVILDIKMPGKTGVELLPEIRGAYSDTAVIMATAVNDTNTAIQCMKQGAYDYMTKPFKMDELILNVERALEKRRLELELRDYKQHLEQKGEEQAKRIRSSFLNAITALVHALEAKDKYTSGHSQRVAKISVKIANVLGMPQDRVEKIELAALVHDIGKIGIRESVLNKTGRLNDEEFKHVQSHCEIGEHILYPIVDDRELLDMVRHHHERYDGTGYPDGLTGEQVSEGAKILALADTYSNIAQDHIKGKTSSQDANILAVADAYDAMLSSRPYRDALPVKQALEEIRRGIGIQFDPVVADAFLRLPISEILEGNEGLS